ETAKIVSSKKDYSVRAAKHSHDELGLLIDGFNEMLTQIQKRDSALQKAHDELEERVKERTKNLQQEVVERKRAEKAVRKSEAKNRAFLDAIPDLILRIHRDGNFLDHKAANEGEAVVVPAAEFKGKSVYEMMPQKVAQQIIQHVQHALKTNEIQVIEYQLPAKGAQVDCEARIVVSGEDEVVAIVRDITERKRVERMKNEFVSTVSHELRTPLTSIRGALGLITGGVAGELPSKARSLLDIAYNNSERLVRLINDILDIEKIESGMMNFKIEPMQLMPLVEQAVEANRAYGKEFGVRIAIEQSLSGIKVKADSDRLIQVMTNLLSNAVKFSPADGTVKVSVSRHAQSIRVAITDQGNGIPEEFRDTIFQKFAQADSSDTRQKGGTGLGLNICKAIIERLGGKIDFETKTGVGATFYFDLPEWHEQEVIVVSDKELQHKPGILICEDDHDVATLLGMMLQEGGFSTDCAYDAEQAKELLERNEYAAMTLDIMLPGQDGISLIRDLRTFERTRQLPIVVVSVKAKEGSEELNGNAFGIIDWLEKPIDQNRLMRAVKIAASRLTGARPRILHVEDDPDIPKVVSMMLQDSADIVCASTLHDAAKKLEQKHFDLAILDIELPDGNGLDLLSHLNSMTPPIPVIIFSAQEVSAECAQNVAAALVKSRHTNEALLDSIRSLINHVGKKAEPVAEAVIEAV
ncbi:MAG: response regulator, partial [bacterium]